MEGCKCTRSSLVTLVAILMWCSNMNLGSNALTTPTYNTVNKMFIQKSCKWTEYPNLCLKSLSSYSGKIKTSYPKLAYTALSLSLKSAKSTVKIVKKLSKLSYMKLNEAAALRDCVDNMKDSIEEIQQSMKEFNNLNATLWDYKMSNIKTWVSAALSDDDTCLEGLDEEYVNKKMKDTISANILRFSQLTSNALVFINYLNYTQLSTKLGNMLLE